MKTAKKCAICGAFTALLIAIQYVFSALKGVELVTIFFFAFCFTFGFSYGAVVALAFTFLRTFIFGFFPTAIILYLIFYPTMAFVAGTMGSVLKKSSNKKQLIFSIIALLFLTLFFTLLDDFITPIFFAYSKNAWVAYIVQSLPVCLIHLVCSLFSSLVLFLPLKKSFLFVLKRIER